MQEVKDSVRPIILFIDEAHTLIGAGNQAGGLDVSNLIKPALARGELRTIALPRGGNTRSTLRKMLLCRDASNWLKWESLQLPKQP